MRLRRCCRSAISRIRPLADGLLCRCLADCVACRVPARRPGNFHLRPQMKVTKAKGLNATPLMRSARFGTAPGGPLDTPPVLTRTLRWARPRCASALGSSVLRGRGTASPCRRAGCCFDAPHCFQWPAGRGSAARRTSERFCIQALCFGDFHLGLQMFAKRGSAHFAQRSYADTKLMRCSLGRGTSAASRCMNSSGLITMSCNRSSESAGRVM